MASNSRGAPSFNVEAAAEAILALGESGPFAAPSFLCSNAAAAAPGPGDAEGWRAERGGGLDGAAVTTADRCSENRTLPRLGAARGR